MFTLLTSLVIDHRSACLLRSQLRLKILQEQKSLKKKSYIDKSWRLKEQQNSVLHTSLVDQTHALNIHLFESVKSVRKSQEIQTTKYKIHIWHNFRDERIRRWHMSCTSLSVCSWYPCTFHIKLLLLILLYFIIGYVTFQSETSPEGLLRVDCYWKSLLGFFVLFCFLFSLSILSWFRVSSSCIVWQGFEGGMLNFFFDFCPKIKFHWIRSIVIKLVG